jgi:hypothetical protein
MIKKSALLVYKNDFLSGKAAYSISNCYFLKEEIEFVVIISFDAISNVV